MRPELSDAKRRAVVRRAARDWERAGSIDRATAASIDARYPDDRVSRTGVWRALVFFFVGVISTSAAGIVFAVFRPSDHAAGVVLVAAAVLMAAATEIQQGMLRFDGTGAEAATSFLAVVSAIAGTAILLPRSSAGTALGTILLVSAILWASAWRRWGFSAYALFGSVSLFFGAGALVREIRLLWLVAGAAALFLSARRSLARSPYRDGWSIIGAAGLAAVYAAVNVYSLDHSLVENLRPGMSTLSPRWAAARPIAAAGTALLPIALLVGGLRRRRRLLIDLGILFAALSLVTLRAYVRLGPLWLVLVEGGAASVALALGVERWLERGPGRERAGLTADPLFEDERRAGRAASVATALVLAPGAAPLPREPEWTPGGGSFGGGGASDTF